MQSLTEGNGLYILMAALVVLLGIVAFLVRKSPAYRPFFGNILVPCVFIALTILFAVITLSFPEEEAGPAALPHLWILVLSVLSVSILLQILITKSDPDPKSGRLDILLAFIASTVAYLLVMQVLGYYLTTFVFLVVIMYLLSYRKYAIMLAIASGWLLFAYVVFQRMLYIPLPQGKLFEMLLQ